MKKTLLFIIILITCSKSWAQDKPINWVHSVRKIADRTYEIHITASIHPGWHLYAQNAGAAMPAPTLISFTRNPLLVWDGKPKEAGKLITRKEPVLGGVVNYYEKTVDFVQLVKVKGKAKTHVAGKVEFTLCNDTRCLPPAEYAFSVPVGG